ncbi:MAG: tRNA lysidine(34) synthetase TilS [Bacteroidota bacterium]
MFSNQVADFIQLEQLFTPDDRLLLGVSGGMDSMVLWHVLRELGYSVAVSHCNFRLRGEESEGDEAFVRSEAEKSDATCFIRQFTVRDFLAYGGESAQETARNLRYAEFENLRVQHDFDYILTAHHLDDRIETFFLNFARGAGLRGLSSLRAKRDFIRRPLLEVNRKSIRAYQEKEAIPYREDSSNATDKYHRNGLRHHILPTFYQWAPRIAQIARQNFSLLEQQGILLQELLDQYRTTLLKQEENGSWSLQTSTIRDHAAAQVIVVDLLTDFGFNKEQARQVLEATAGSVLASPTHELLVQHSEASIRLKQMPSTSQEIKTWPQHEAILRFADQQLKCAVEAVPAAYSTPSTEALIAAEALQWPLQVRYWQAGDTFCPLGMNGKKQKLQDFFVNNKINQFKRQQVPLLVNGNGQIIWIVGHRLDDRFKLQSDTSTVFRFQVLPTK